VIAKEEGRLISYSILIGLILTFVSLIYISEEPYCWVDWGSTYPIGHALTYGFPFGWRAFGGPSAFFSPFDIVAFLFDIIFWAIIAYFTLRYIAPNFIKFMSKNFQLLSSVNYLKKQKVSDLSKLFIYP